MAKGGQRAGFPQGSAPGLLFTGWSWALFLQDARSSDPPNRVALFQEEDWGEPKQEKSGSGTRNQSGGKKGESEPWDGPVGYKGVLQPPWPL